MKDKAGAEANAGRPKLAALIAVYPFCDASGRKINTPLLAERLRTKN